MNNLKKNGGYKNINVDYTMPNLENLISCRSIEVSKLIWKTLEWYGSKNDEYDYSTVRYRYSNYGEIWSKDPEYICLLKKYAWIPNKQGNMFKPQDISLSDLRRDFVYDPKNRILVRLGIGSALIHQSRKQEQLKRKAEKVAMEAGGHFISHEKYQEYEEKSKRLEKLESQIKSHKKGKNK